jgi:hypothetical protein
MRKWAYRIRIYYIRSGSTRNVCQFIVVTCRVKADAAAKADAVVMADEVVMADVVAKADACAATVALAGHGVHIVRVPVYNSHASGGIFCKPLPAFCEHSADDEVCVAFFALPLQEP